MAITFLEKTSKKLETDEINFNCLKRRIREHLVFSGKINGKVR